MSPAALRASSMGAGVTVAEPLEGVVLSLFAVSRALAAVSRAVMAAVRLSSL